MSTTDRDIAAGHLDAMGQVLTAEEMVAITPAPIIARTDDLTRADWLQLRKVGLGGSDAAAVLGVSKWTSSFSLWLDKTTDDTNDQGTLAMRRGTHLEPFILAEAMVKDPELTIARAPYMLRHPDHDELLANLDGIGRHARRRTPGGVEAKNVNTHQTHQWDDGPPLYYAAQVAHYMAVTGLDWWAVCADFGGDDLRVFYIERDDELMALVVERELAWWHRHIVEGAEPEIDGHAATTEALSLVEADLGSVRVLDPDEVGEVREIMTALAQVKTYLEVSEADEALLKNRLRHLIGDAETLLDESGTKWATWKQGKPKTVVDWQAVAVDLAGRLTSIDGDPIALVDETAEQFTTAKPGNRPLMTAPGLKAIKEN